MSSSAPKHRFRRARDRAGLSVDQAAHLIGMDRDDLWDVEQSTDLPADPLIRKMTDVYGVCAEWLVGTAPQRDYAAVRAMPGWEDLCFADRDAIAEFAASMPRRTQ